MKISIGNLHYIAKRLQASSRNTAIGDEVVDPPLTPGEIAVLDYLVEQQEAKSIREIVAGTGLVQSWVSTVVKSLNTRGWVTVSTLETDKRVTTVKATETVMEGASLVQRRDANEVIMNLIPNASVRDKEIIRLGLETLFDAIISEEQSEQKTK